MATSTPTKGLLPTPPLPKGLPKVNLTENAYQVFVRRYVRKGPDGKPVETPEETFWRVAYHVAKAESEFGASKAQIIAQAKVFYKLLIAKRYIPNSPTWTGAGTPLGQLAACFVLPISDDMGRKDSGIFMTLRNAALIQQTGGGNGFSFSRLRPKGALVKSSAGQATGPVGFLRVYDKAFGEIAQGGCLLPETLVFTEEGLLRLDELVNAGQAGWQKHRRRIATDEGLRPSPAGYNNGVAAVLRVQTREGLSLTGTPDHKVKVMSETGPVWRALADLKPGDWMIVRLGQHRGRLQTLRHPERRHGNQVWPRLPAVLDEELAFFVGYLIGDGFVASQESDHRIGVSVAHKSYLMAEMPRLLERLFGVTVHRQQKPHDRSATFVVDNRAVKEFLQLNGLVKGNSRTAQVPRLIRLSPPNVVGAFLRGLLEADGSLLHGYPSLTTTSPELAREVATLLLGLGAPVKIRQTAPGVDHWGQHTVYQVRIVSHVGLEAWRKWIGADQRSRFVAAYAWEADTRRESSYVLPFPRYWLAPVLEAITLPQHDARGRGRGINFRSTEPRLRKHLLRYLRQDRQLTISAFRNLRERYPEAMAHAPEAEGFWFVQVGEITPAGEHLTLDLEVEDNHTYLAYGLVTHNSRRGANMAVLRIDHPDVEDFITCKTDENAITNFNISVGITDAFMRAVENDEEWELRFPDVLDPRYHDFDGTIDQAEAAGIPIKTYRKVRARDLFDKIVKQAHHNGEPGVLFLDTANRANPVPHLYPLESTNPCGEQWLGPYENCCLGSINLAQHVTEDGKVDWEKLRETTERAVRFLDDVVEANAYVPAVPQLKEAAHRARRIGLGIMGLADLMYVNGVRYGSPEGQEFAAQVMEFVRYHAMRTSIELAKERGPFPAIKGSIYDPENLKWQPPQWPDWLGGGPKTDWGRPPLDWDAIVEGIRKHGIRNAAQTTIAPTGTVSTVSGVEGYGCEPVFALAYIRHVNDNGKDLQLTYTSPLFMKALEEAGLDEETRNRIIEQVLEQGTCQHIPEVPEHIKHTFVVASDITAEEHVYTQAALQVFVDNSISKCVVGDTLVLTESGLTPIASLGELRLPDQFAPLNANVVSPTQVEKADAFYYGGWRETRRIALRYGLTLEGTPNHRVHVLNANGQVVFRRLDELKPGDLVVMYAGQRRFGKAGAPLPPFSGAFRTSSHHITFPKRMSEDLAFFLGAVTAEGALTVNGVNISNTDRALLEDLRRIAEAQFGLHGYIARDKRNSVHYLQLNSRPLRHWLVADLGLEAGAENKRIPDVVLRAAEDEVSAFLRGLFLDAFMTQDGRTFGITLASERLIHQLQVLLLNMDVVATVRRTAERAWNLTVQGDELERLAGQIGFVEAWKNERIARRNAGRLHIRRNYSRLLPEMVTEALRAMQETGASLRRGFAVAQAEEARTYQRVCVNLRAGHRLTRTDAHRVYETLRSQGASHPVAEAFFAHDNEHKLYVPVERVETGFAEVYDISVPGSHTFIANGLGNHNTVNFPADATPDDVAKAYKLAWELGIKGLTVYVTGSREKVVLETKATAKAKGKDVALEAPTAQSEQPRLWNEPKKPRPSVLRGRTYRIETPVGRAFITINENGGGQPFEVFINTAKAGSETAAISEAMGRLISYILRLTSTVEPRERLREIWRQLSGIGGGRSAGFGPNRVRSLPDGIAQAIKRYLESEPSTGEEEEEKRHTFSLNLPSLLPLDGKEEPAAENTVETLTPPAEKGEKPLDITQVGDICPECGAAAVVYTEGCARCYACGYSECK